MELRPHRLTAVFLVSGIRSLIEAATFRSVRFFQCSTPRGNTRRKPESFFGENQLLQRSISFSLQPTSHPKILHNLRVRPSIYLSINFSLLMGSSRCFGSNTYNLWSRYSHSLSLWLHPKGLSRAIRINSLAHSSIGTPSRCKHLFDSL